MKSTAPSLVGHRNTLKRFACGVFFSAAAIASGAGTGCADNNQSIYIGGVLSAQVTDGRCTFDPTSTALSPGGSFELASGGERFTMTLVYSLDLGARGNPKDLKSEPNRAYVRTAEVTLRDENQRTIAAFSVDVAQSLINPGGDRALVQVPVITPAVMPALTAAVPNAKPLRVFADVRLFATTVSGNEISSAPFQYPIDVTRGGRTITGISKDGMCIPGSKGGVACELGTDGASIPCEFCPPSFRSVCGTL